MKKTGAILGSAAMALSLLLSWPALAQDIDFGDDSGRWANDGECDDPRFGGTVDSHRMADATDCRTAYEAGEVTFDGAVTVSGAVQPGSEIDFGDDSGRWANDGECDDPRFGGFLENHIRADATDCRAAYEDDPSIYIGSESSTTDDNANDISGIDFGDDSGEFSNDNMCDDARFLPVAVFDYSRLFVGTDATDCRQELAAGNATYVATTDIGSIDFGDDSGTHANDGECEDPRFVGPGTYDKAIQDWIRADATDCRAAMAAGAYYIGMAFAEAGTGGGESSTGEDGGSVPNDTSAFIGSIDFGDNSSDYANNGACDDPRFTGPGTDTTLLFADRMADADDCRALYAQGEIHFNGVDGDPALAGVAEIDFGDDASEYADNDWCDDPRFTGPGTDSLLLHGDLGHDATDCRALFESGEVYLAGLTRAGDTGSAGQSTGNFRINFGDDTGSHPHNGECDDPRFQGRGGALELFDDNLLGDATDCRAAYEAGTVTYAP